MSYSHIAEAESLVVFVVSSAESTGNWRNQLAVGLAEFDSPDTPQYPRRSPYNPSPTYNRWGQYLEKPVHTSGSVWDTLFGISMDGIYVEFLCFNCAFEEKKMHVIVINYAKVIWMYLGKMFLQRLFLFFFLPSRELWTFDEWLQIFSWKQRDWHIT